MPWRRSPVMPSAPYPECLRVGDRDGPQCSSFLRRGAEYLRPVWRGNREGHQRAISLCLALDAFESLRVGHRDSLVV